jgi:preprotein translocase subunit YajC
VEFVLLPLSIVALFYFILLRPVLSSQKRHKQNIARLEIGDEVLTTGGFYAIVNAIESQEDGPPLIVLEVADGIEIEGTPAAIQSVNPRGALLDDDDLQDVSGTCLPVAVPDEAEGAE